MSREYGLEMGMLVSEYRRLWWWLSGGYCVQFCTLGLGDIVD